MNNTLLVNILGLMIGLTSFQSAAHFPLMSCHLAQDQVICEAGYSDGSTAVGYDVNMYDYDDNLVAKVTTDKRSIAQFTHPNTDFYLVFDAGHENPVEVDVVELKPR
ncbi:hypothetical protein [Vibrio salilacus]|uniref:hypothetical protein n=1 Tax=Vibrio salilacus TaxID=1323749 RepID=UPI000C2A3EF8|nr:hypothetical protein [Vibrio salilacus]